MSPFGNIKSLADADPATALRLRVLLQVQAERARLGDTRPESIVQHTLNRIGKPDAAGTQQLYAPFTKEEDLRQELLRLLQLMKE